MLALNLVRLIFDTCAVFGDAHRPHLERSKDKDFSFGFPNLRVWLELQVVEAKRLWRRVRTTRRR